MTSVIEHKTMATHFYDALRVAATQRVIGRNLLPSSHIVCPVYLKKLFYFLFFFGKMDQIIRDAGVSY